MALARITTTIWLTVLTALLAVPAALAQDGTQDSGYPGGGVGGDVENRLSTAGSTASGQLPFTGLNLVILVVGGVVLLGLGAMLLLRGRGTGNTV